MLLGWKISGSERELRKETAFSAPSSGYLNLCIFNQKAGTQGKAGFGLLGGCISWHARCRALKTQISLWGYNEKQCACLHPSSWSGAKIGASWIVKYEARKEGSAITFDVQLTELSKHVWVIRGHWGSSVQDFSHLAGQGPKQGPKRHDSETCRHFTSRKSATNCPAGMPHKVLPTWVVWLGWQPLGSGAFGKIRIPFGAFPRA